MTVLITGAGRGLGRRTAELMSRLGWRVLLACRDRDSGEAVAAALRDSLADGEVHVLPLDVADPGAIADAVRLAGRLTDGRLEALVNNAGVFLDEADEGLESLTAAACQRIFAVNAIGPLLVTQAFLPLLRASGNASVVTVSSDDADPRTADGTYTCYRMSKAAVNQMTANLAVELRPYGIAVNAVYPGWIPTDMGGPEAPDDIDAAAELVAWAAALPVMAPGTAPTGQIFSVGAPPWESADPRLPQGAPAMLILRQTGQFVLPANGLSRELEEGT